MLFVEREGGPTAGRQSAIWRAEGPVRARCAVFYAILQLACPHQNPLVEPSETQNKFFPSHTIKKSLSENQRKGEALMVKLNP